MGVAVFKKEPKSVDVRTFLGRVVKRYGAPKYIISEKGRQFDCDGTRIGADARESIHVMPLPKTFERPP